MLKTIITYEFWSMSFKVKFSYADRKLQFGNKTKLKQLVQDLFIREKMLLNNIQYVFCSDNYLFNINKRFLKHNTLTDIITFPLSEKSEPIEAEIYISIDRVKENSKLINSRFSDELVRVVCHGALHLCGYSDKKKADITKMRKREDFFIKLFNSN